jgi:acyl-coenzyme A thioesterase PaaI-like protein
MNNLYSKNHPKTIKNTGTAAVPAAGRTRAMSVPVFDDYCFACGQRNPIGLHMQVSYNSEDLSAESRLSLAPEYVGWQEVIHGGILATLLDEIMSHAIWHFAGPAVTLGLDIQFRQTLAPGQLVVVQGRLTQTKGRRLQAQGSIIRLADGRLIANAQGRFLLPPPAGPEAG